MLTIYYYRYKDKKLHIKASFLPARLLQNLYNAIPTYLLM